MAEQVDTPLKVVVDVISRPQTDADDIAGWLDGLEAWSARAVVECVAAAPDRIGVVLESSTYRLKITDRGVRSGRRLWSIYPKRTVSVTVNDGQTEVWEAELDAFYRAYQTEIRAEVAAAPGLAQLETVRWHMHLNGVTNEVEPR